MNKYGFLGKFNIQPGKRDEFIAVLLKAAQLMEKAKGCHQYLIYIDPKDENAVYSSEIWDSKQDHDNSFKMEGSMELISTGMPLVVGKPQTTELELLGGKGS